jgi:Flp pilus assembly pilin Flp
MTLQRVKGVWNRLFVKSNEAGQTLVEYSLIISLIAISAIVGITMVAGGLDSLWSGIGERVANAVDSVLDP